MRKLVCCLGFLCGIAGPAISDDYETVTISEFDAWTVNYVHDNNENFGWCEAVTHGDNIVMDITGWSDGGVTLYFHNSNWQLAERPVPIQVHVDYEVYTAEAQAGGNRISVDIDGEAGVDFITDFMQKSALSLLNQNGDRLASFSLSGSKAAMEAWFACWSGIWNSESVAESADPFGEASYSADPFL